MASSAPMCDAFGNASFPHLFVKSITASDYSRIAKTSVERSVSLLAERSRLAVKYEPRPYPSNGFALEANPTVWPIKIQ
jgi:hypothetical protein